MRVVKFVKVSFVLIVSLIACSQSSENKILVSESWKSFSEPKFSIEYPDNWDLSQSKEMGTSFILFSPLTSEKDKFKENVNLIIQDLTGHNLDLDKYVKLSESQVNTMITDGRILESKTITKSDTSYHKVVYSGKQGVFDLKFEQYCWVVENKAYVLTFTAEENVFNEYKTAAERILNSFKIKLT